MTPSSNTAASQLLGGSNSILAELYSQPGVSGCCVQSGRTVLAHDLPFSDDRVDRFASRVDHLLLSYTGVGRTVWHICLGFEKFWVLVLARDRNSLSILLQPNTDTTMIASRAAHLLMGVDIVVEKMKPAPKLPPASAITPLVPSMPAVAETPGIPVAELEQLLTALLSRVMGSAQTSKLIARELQRQGANGVALRPERAREMGLAVIDFIGNRSKRDALASEFLNAIK